MGNSVSCFDRVSEHPPYSWPRDHPDRERAIAERNERRRARRNNKIAQRAVRTGAKPEQVKPEPAKPASEPAQPDQQQQQPPQTEPTVETTPQVQQEAPAPVAAAESPEKDAVQPEPKDEQHVEALAEAAVETAAEEQVENEIEHVEKQPKSLAEPSEITPELLEPDTVDQTPETAVEPIVAEKELVEELTEDTVQKEPSTKLEPNPVEEAAELAVEQSQHDHGKIEQAAEEAVPIDAPEAIVAVDSQEQQPAEEEALTPMVADTAAQETSPVKPVEEDEQVDKEPESPAPKATEEEAAILDAPEQALTAKEAVKEDDEMPSIDSRRAMFDRSEDQLPKPVDLRRDVLDPVTNEYITLEEYRKRQSERAQGLVKERLEKFEEIDDEISKEKAELAAIVAARSDAQKKADWRYKQGEVKSPKLKSRAVKEVDSKVEELDRSVMTGSVAGLSAKFNDEGAVEEVDSVGEEAVSPVVKRMDFVEEKATDAVDSTAVTEEVVDVVEEVVTTSEVIGLRAGVEEDAIEVEEEVDRIVESATGGAGGAAKESLLEGNTTETATAAASATATTTALPSS